MTTEKIKVGLIGLGRMGKVHFRHLYQSIQDVRLIAVSDALQKKEDFERDIKGISFSNDPDDLINDSSIDALVICTPTSTHADLVSRAINKRKNIFCEKPLDLSLEKTDAVLKMAKQSGIKLMLGFNRRFDPEFAHAKKMVNEGRIGRLQVIKITNRDPGIPPVEFIKTSGGMFMDFSIHDFDMVRFIMNKEATEVFARGMVFMDPAVGEAGDIDTALITVTFDDSTYAVIDNSRRAMYGYDQRLEVFGDEGMIQVENNLYHQNVVFDENGIHHALPLNNFTERYERSYLREMELFIDAVRNDKELPVSGDDMLEATIMAYAARKSMLESRPVKLSEITWQD